MFENEKELSFDDKELLRFKEIDTLHLFNTFVNSFGMQKSQRLLQDLLGITHQNKHEFNNILNPQNKPTKKELVLYGRYKGMSYAQINQQYGISSRTIKKYIDDYHMGLAALFPKTHELSLDPVIFFTQNLKEFFNKSQKS